MKCSVYIATSADGYIATADGGVDWLHTAGNLEADMRENPDMGFQSFIDSVDCMSYSQIWWMAVRRQSCLIDRLPAPHPETGRCSRPAPAC